MSVAITSIENYIEHRESGKLGKQAISIYGFLTMHQNRDWSRAELARAMHLPLSSVCGRVNEMIHQGNIITVNKRNCFVTGKTVNTIKAKL
jgi:hypothetical protein